MSKIIEQARQQGRKISVSRMCIEGGFASASLKEAICSRFLAEASGAQALLLCQASMASIAEELQKQLKIPVLASPDYGMRELKCILQVQ